MNTDDCLIYMSQSDFEVFTPETLKKMLEEYGTKDEQGKPCLNLFGVLCCRALKAKGITP